MNSSDTVSELMGGEYKRTKLTEDELLKSDDEIVADSKTDYTSYSTPASFPNSSSSKISDNIPSTSHSRPNANHAPTLKIASLSSKGKVKSRKKTASMARKNRYQRALFMLKKIESNKKEGNVHERDEADTEKYRAIVEEYLHDEGLRQSDITGKNVGDGGKRNRSQEDPGMAAKRRKNVTGDVKPIPRPTQAARPFSEVARDHLSVALIDERNSNSKMLMERWALIETKLSELVMAELMTNPGSVPSFDCADIVRGHRVIRCDDEYSRNFFSKAITKISENWDGLRLKLISAAEIPSRPRARVWLPKNLGPPDLILQQLKLQNPEIQMEDWSVLKTEEPQKHSQSYLLLINEECLPVIEANDCKLRYGIRKAKIKIFKNAPPDNILDEVEGTSKLLDDLIINKKLC
ncbi:uncharacterized protein LOC119672301 [Teleopsis dalmanni]|uniref:uncharacterized protein LOC119672301 n=1 Tax=Teleopsis dalmanni TaxID=139649 RepID=UPI0018CF0583|nr:uncharacterized protein LOC119672301 [Teleopsis dalmanni]XP_037939252.1 uncharacterized protein LOC119672301 [Teleopsis dalmanni]